MIRIFFLSALALTLSCRGQKDSPGVGSQAPDFVATDPDGNQFRLSDFQGKQVLLHFWADWCSDCRAEFPKLQQAYLKNRASGFEIVAVNVGQAAQHVRSFVQNYNLTFPMLLDENSSIAKLYGLRGLPTNYFIDEKGNIEKIIIGWVVENQINRILEKNGEDQ